VSAGLDAVLFDLDDTLVAFDAVTDLCWQAVIAEHCAGHPGVDGPALFDAVKRVSTTYWSDPERHRVGRLDMEATRARLVTDALRSLALPADGAEALAARYGVVRIDAMYVLPRARRTLEDLRGRGVRLALLTNGDGGGQRRKIERFALAPLFEVILVEGEIGFGKPDRRVFDLALRRLGVPADRAVMVGDNYAWDIEGARRAGIAAVWIDRKGAGVPPGAETPLAVVPDVARLVPALAPRLPAARVLPVPRPASTPRVSVADQLAANCGRSPERAAWLERLPHTLRAVSEGWSLTLGEPFDGPEVSCGWVGRVRRADGTPAVLKLAMPHMEGEDEIAGLRFWAGDPAALVLEADEECGAMLLEMCEPGTRLRELPEPEQDAVIAGLLRRLWRAPRLPHRFRPLAAMVSFWSAETRADEARWPDPGLVREGLRAFEDLARPAPDDVLLATDLHAGNVLAARRLPWLVIDPKPFVGDPAYDATQHLLNCEDRLRADPDGLIGRIADLAGLDGRRVRLWLFARAAAESRDTWGDDSLARLLSP
jgi:streptomycin 6-kinase